MAAARPASWAGSCGGSSGASARSVAASRPFPPALAAALHAEQRIRRMLQGETTERSELDPEWLVAKLQAHGVAPPRGEPRVRAVVDGSALRQPHARAMEHLQRVERRDRRGTANGGPTPNVIGIGKERPGLLSHALSSGAAPDVPNEPAEVQAAIRSDGHHSQFCSSR